MVKDTIRKSIFFGLGLAAVTKDTAEKFVRGLVKEGELTINEGTALVNDILKESDKTQKKVRKIVDEQVNNVLQNLPVATKSDLKELERRLRNRR